MTTQQKAKLMQGTVSKLYTYPVKGLSAVRHDAVNLTKGLGFPGDREFGFAKMSSGFDQKNPQPLPKDKFIVLLEHAALAGLQSDMNPETLTLTLRGRAGVQHVFDLGTDVGTAEASNFFVQLLNLSPEDAPFFAQAQPHRFTDVSVVSPEMMQAVSLINLASVRELAGKTGVAIDPARFRGNIIMDGWPPFAELDLIGSDIKIGRVTFHAVKKTRRCGATRVNPVTAERDLDMLDMLKSHYGHLFMGIYIETRSTGWIAVNDPVSSAV